MTWLDSLASWLGDPANVSDMVPSVVVILCTIALIVTVAVSTRALGKRIQRALTEGDPTHESRNDLRSHRRDRVEPVTGPQRSGATQTPAPTAPLTPPPAVASVAPPLPPSMTTPPPSAQAFARASALDNDPLNQ